MPPKNFMFCGRTCQGKIQGKTSNFSRTISPQWADEEIEMLRLSYELNIPIDIIAAQLSRSTAGVYCKAHALHFTNNRRPKHAGHVEKMRAMRRLWWKSIDEETKQRIVSHPCSEKTRKKIGTAIRNSKAHKAAMQNANLKQKHSDRMKQIHAAGSLKGGYSRGKKGMREDIGIYVRSSWEANYARYLNIRLKCNKIVGWRYEPKRFTFDDIKRGTRSYLPDFEVTCLDGSVEYHEVKGYWTQRGKTAVKRFRKRYPAIKLLIIDRVKYSRIKRHLAHKIENWE